MLQSVEIRLPIVLWGRSQAEISDDFTAAIADAVAVPRNTKIGLYLNMLVAQLLNRFANLFFHKPYSWASGECGGHANDNRLFR